MPEGGGWTRKPARRDEREGEGGIGDVWERDCSRKNDEGERMVGLEKLPDGTIEKRFASVNDCLAGHMTFFVWPGVTGDERDDDGFIGVSRVGTCSGQERGFVAPS